MTVNKEQAASWIRNFNPFLSQESALWPSKGGVYEPLAIYNTMTAKYVPWLATSFSWSEDSKALTFNLREGVKWSDGRPFVAKDVAFTFGLMKRHAALDMNQLWSRIESVAATDERTVVFRFVQPFVPALVYIAHQPIVPEHIWKDVKDPVAFTNENPVATGPFTEVRVFKNQVYELGRNPNYWQPGKPAIRALRMPAYSSNEHVNLALVNDEIDWAGTFVPAIERIFVGPDPQHHAHWSPLTSGAVLLYANTKRKPFDDVNVRKAISMAIDRELIVKVAMNNHTRPADATALNDAYASVLDAEAVRAGTWVVRDVAAANALLDSGGYARGDDGLRRTHAGDVFRYEIIVPAGWSDWVRVAQVSARSLREIGIDAKLRMYDFGAWFSQLRYGDFDLSLGWTEDGPTPYNLYRGLMSAHLVKPIGEGADSNWHRFASPTADELLTRFESAVDEREKTRLLAELQRLFVAEAPAIPLFPGPAWAEYNTKRFVGFPTAEDPYAQPTPHAAPECLLVLTRLRPRGAPEPAAPVAAPALASPRNAEVRH